LDRGVDLASRKAHVDRAKAASFGNPQASERVPGVQVMAPSSRLMWHTTCSICPGLSQYGGGYTGGSVSSRRLARNAVTGSAVRASATATQAIAAATAPSLHNSQPRVQVMTAGRTVRRRSIARRLRATRRQTPTTSASPGEELSNPPVGTSTRGHNAAGGVVRHQGRTRRPPRSGYPSAAVVRDRLGRLPQPDALISTLDVDCGSSGPAHPLGVHVLARSGRRSCPG
jgi:hypothetical protein